MPPKGSGLKAKKPGKSDTSRDMDSAVNFLTGALQDISGQMADLHQTIIEKDSAHRLVMDKFASRLSSMEENLEERLADIQLRDMESKEAVGQQARGYPHQDLTDLYGGAQASGGHHTSTGHSGYDGFSHDSDEDQRPRASARAPASARANTGNPDFFTPPQQQNPGNFDGVSLDF